MKINNVHFLMSLVVGLLLTALILFFIFDKKRINPNNKTNPTTVLNTNEKELNIESQLNKNTSQNLKTQTQINNVQKNTVIRKQNTQSNHSTGLSTSQINANAHSNEHVDFSKYITDSEQIEEIRLLTNRNTDDLVIEKLPNNEARVDLKRRFSTVNVAIVDENGVVHRGEWAPPEK
ncbi:hypothetical protein [Marinicellulosiphila megalodicopiae]|uniref:hypothetical protein n=1 Tax=Marinicellulosiphila megalodicopiae TaxID=2724896 RepID=UPI003BB1B248